VKDELNITVTLTPIMPGVSCSPHRCFVHEEDRRNRNSRDASQGVFVAFLAVRYPCRQGNRQCEVYDDSTNQRFCFGWPLVDATYRDCCRSKRQRPPKVQTIDSSTAFHSAALTQTFNSTARCTL
jgi:hypothetical protein